MQKWDIYVNTLLMERDIQQLRQNLSRICQHLEMLEVVLAEMENYWEGQAKEVCVKVLWEGWEQLHKQKKELEKWIEAMEQIRNLYIGGERQVWSDVTALRIEV